MNKIITQIIDMYLLRQIVSVTAQKKKLSRRQMREENNFTFINFRMDGGRNF